jgi:hypothetical protein
MNIKEAVEEYQCSGCVGGTYEECFKKATHGVGCGGHCPGTLLSGVGIFLGMPKGFMRLGPIKNMPLFIFEDDWSFFDKFNIPVWKYLDEFGHTLVRGLSPRVNMPFLHVYLKDIRDKINCFELTRAEIDAMD